MRIYGTTVIDTDTGADADFTGVPVTAVVSNCNRYKRTATATATGVTKRMLQQYIACSQVKTMCPCLQ